MLDTVGLHYRICSSCTVRCVVTLGTAAAACLVALHNLTVVQVCLLAPSPILRSLFGVC